jgi:hypothetical protein
MRRDRGVKERDLLSHFDIYYTGMTIFQSKILKGKKWNLDSIGIFTLRDRS